MAKFIPRTVGGNQQRGFRPYRGRGRGGRGGARGGGRGGFVPIGDQGGNFRGRGGRGIRPFVDRGIRGRILHSVSPERQQTARRSVTPERRGPVSLVLPSDPQHPRNLAKKKQDDDRKKMAQKNDHSDNSNMSISDSPPGAKDREEDRFSDEGLRITVENKAGSLVAGPSFYDEIMQKSANEQSKKVASPEEMKLKEKEQQRGGSSPQRSRSKSPKSKKASKKSGKEHIRITVGNDRFTSEAASKDSGSPRRSLSKDTQSRDGQSKDRDNFSQDRDPVRRRGSPDRRRPRSRERRRSRSSSRDRGRFRSRSRSPERFGGRPGFRRRWSRGRSRSRSRSRSRGRYYSRSPSRSQRSSSGSRSPSPYRRGGSPPRRRSRGRSFDSISDESVDWGRGGNRNNDPRSRKDARQPPGGAVAPNKWQDPAPARDNPPEAPRQPQASKANPFMEFLNDLDFKKFGDEAVLEKERKREEKSLPWLHDAAAKGSNIQEIEQYLEKKLQALNPPRPSSHEVQQTHGRNIQASVAGRPMKEASPFDIYGNITQPTRTASPPPLEAKPVRSILKKKEPPTQAGRRDPFFGALGGASDLQQEEEQFATDRQQPPQQQQLHQQQPRQQQPRQQQPRQQQPRQQQQQAVPIPGIASMMNIEDEDEFLYGGGGETAAPSAPAAASKPVDADVYLGGYAQGADPGWEVAPAKATAPIVEDKPEEKLTDKKPEPDKLSGDPTIQNILKSIGFNFELSKLMQEKAKDIQKKKEDIEAFGIKQGSSFLAGGTPAMDIESAISAEPTVVEEKKQREIRKPVVDKKESYEERARRYLQEQKRGLPEAANAYPPAQQQQPVFSSQGADFTPHNPTMPQHVPTDYDNQYQGEYGNTDWDFPGQAQPGHSSNLISLVETGQKRQQQDASALRNLQTEYHEPDQFRDYDGRRHRDQYGYPGDDRHGNSSREYRNREYDRDMRFPDRDMRMEGYGDRHHGNEMQQRERYSRLERTEDDKQNLFPIVREKKLARSPSPSDDWPAESSSRRTVIPPKTEDEGSERRKINFSIKTKSQLSDGQNGSEQKPVKKVSKMTAKEREELVQEIEERQKRLKALEKELLRLRKQENELMRKKQRQKDGQKDHNLLEQNTELQKEIGQQIDVLRRATEVNASLLAVNKDTDDDFSEDTKKRKRSPSPPSNRQRSFKRAPSRSVSRDRSLSPDVKIVAVEKKQKSTVQYEFFDPGNHWCKQCNQVCSNVYEVFAHLQSKKHVQKLDPYDRPWMPESLKNPVKADKGQTVAAPFKGVEFLMATQAFYCSLCREFSGDSTCAEEHLKSDAHNEKFQAWVRENPFYERRYNLDKAAGLSMISGSVVMEQPRQEPERSSRQEIDRSRQGTERSGLGTDSPRDDRYDRRPDRSRDRSRERSRDRDSDKSWKKKKQTRRDRDDDYYDADKKSSSSSKPGTSVFEDYDKKRREFFEKLPDRSASTKDKYKKKEERSDEKSMKRTIVATPKPQESKPQEGKNFGKFTWKAPLIGKAPGFKKSKPIIGESEKITLKFSAGKGNNSSSSSIKVAPGKPQENVQEIPVPPAPGLQDIDLDPAKFLRKEKVYGPSPAPTSAPAPAPGVKMFDQPAATLSAKKEERAPVAKSGVLSPSTIAEAFSGRSEEPKTHHDDEPPPPGEEIVTRTIITSRPPPQ